MSITKTLKTSESMKIECTAILIPIHNQVNFNFMVIFILAGGIRRPPSVDPSLIKGKY